MTQTRYHQFATLFWACSLAAAAGCSLGAESSISDGVARAELLAPADGDLFAAAIVSVDLARAATAERAPVSASWPAGADADPAPATPFVAQSRGYRLTVDASELAAGVSLPVTTPGPTILLSTSEGSAISIESLALTDAASRSLPRGDGIEVAASAEDLRRSPAPFVPGATMFRVDPALGVGALTLASDAPLADDEVVVIQLQEANSEVALIVQAGADTYLQGDDPVVTARWSNPAGRVPTTESIAGTLTSPTGEATPVTLAAASDGSFRSQSDSFHTAGVSEALAAAPPGHLWELEVDASGALDAQEIRRTVKTAFAIVRPTARPTREVRISRSARGVALELTVEVGSPGRYAVTGALHAPQGGVLAPRVIAQSAAFAEPGTLRLTLEFETPGEPLEAPLELRDLRLTDQTRVGLLHRQARALVLR